MKNVLNRILLAFLLVGPTLMFATFIEADPERLTPLKTSDHPTD